MKRLFALLLTITSIMPKTADALPFEECFTHAADRYSVDKTLLVAIAQTESRLNPNAIGPRNENGTYDIGLMQINSGWIETLSRYGISRTDLVDGCTNIQVGAWIMANNIAVHGSTWRAVGAYNAKANDKRVKYVSKVQKNYLVAQALVTQ